MHRNDSNELQAARARLVGYSARLLDDGLAVGSAGNMSVRCGDIIAITPSGIPYSDLRPADICLVTPDGTQLGNDTAEPPSSETPMHLAVYAATGAAVGPQALERDDAFLAVAYPRLIVAHGRPD